MKNSILLLLAFVFTGFVTASAQSSVDGQVVSELKVFKIVVLEDGSEQATEATEVKPGDVIEYRLVYTNQTNGSISQLLPVLPIPAGIQYQSQSAFPALSGASVAAVGEILPLPLKRQERLPSGLLVERMVSEEEFRRLQWLVSTLAAGEQITLTARAKVISN